MIVSLSGYGLQGKPNSMPRLQVLSLVEIVHQIYYDGPTWLDRALFTPERLHVSPAGFGAELNQALADRGRWLTQQMLAAICAMEDPAVPSTRPKERNSRDDQDRLLSAKITRANPR